MTARLGAPAPWEEARFLSGSSRTLFENTTILPLEPE